MYRKILNLTARIVFLVALFTLGISIQTTRALSFGRDITFVECSINYPYEKPKYRYAANLEDHRNQDIFGAWADGSTRVETDETFAKSLYSNLINTPEYMSDISYVVKPGSIEVLRKDDSGQPTVVRVFLSMGLGPLDDTGLMGTWSYLIQATDGVYIFDAGMRYSIFRLLKYYLGDSCGAVTADRLSECTLDLDTWLSNLNAHIDVSSRCGNKLIHLHNTRYILDAINKYFPNQPVKEILISHWHWDHTENAPDLQAKLMLRPAQRGLIPLIRVAERDRDYPDDDNGDGIPGGERDSISGTEEVFRQACYTSGTWVVGSNLEDGEVLDGSSFRVVFTPGHTYGSVILISDQEQMTIIGPLLVICPPYGFGVPNPPAILHESPETILESCKKLHNQAATYDWYTSHPGFDVLR